MVTPVVRGRRPDRGARGARLHRHARFTASERAKTIIDNWNDYLPKFKKVMPVEYRRALAELKAQEAVPMRLAGE